MEQIMEQPQHHGRDKANKTTMSPLTVVHRYLSTNSAKSTFLRNTGLVVRITSLKPSHDQDLQAQQNDTSVLQTQIQSLIETVCEI